MQQGRQVLPGEFPLEGFSHAFVEALESVETLNRLGKRAKIIRRDGLVLQDGEVDFDLISTNWRGRDHDPFRCGYLACSRATQRCPR